MITVGFDVATHTGIARVNHPTGDKGAVIHFEQTGMERLQSIAKQVEWYVDLWKPDRCAVESYAFGPNRVSNQRLVEVGTVVRTVLYLRKIPWFEVKPTVLKAWTTGKGNAKKPLMAEKVQERWGFVSPSHDIVDAYALAQMAQLSEEELLAIKGVVRGK